MSVRGAVHAMVAVLLLTSACSSSPAEQTPLASGPTAAPSTAPTPEVPVSGRYVAIGDSYTAGPGIAPVDQESGLCLRSTANFPSLLAERLGTTVVDVSCSGATTATATDGARGLAGAVDPQLDAVTEDTDLVTVGLGGNDGGLFQTLLRSCSQDVATCRQYVSGRASDVLASTTDDLTRVLRSVTSRAPEATVVLVGYPRLSPATGTCAAAGIAAAAQDVVRDAETLLDDALRTAAADVAGVRFVSLRDASRGHDACAGADAWTNGATASNDDGIVFHPRASGMQAIADVIARALA